MKKNILRSGHDRCFLLLAALAIIPAALSAQDTRFRIEPITTRDGLLQSTVYAMLQDSHGFIWFGTRDGLDRYDGYRFHSYRYDPFDTNSLSGVVVMSIVEDRDGNIWAGTSLGGLNRIDRRSGRVTRIRNEGVGRPLAFGVYPGWLAVDPDGNIWIASASGLERYNPQSGQFRKFAQGGRGEPPFGEVPSIYIDQSGNVWVCVSAIVGPDRFSRFDRRNYLCRYNSQTDTFSNHAIGTYGSFLQLIGEDPAGTFYVSHTGVDTASQPLLYTFNPSTSKVTWHDVPSRQSQYGLVPLLAPLFVDESNFCWYLTGSPTRFAGPQERYTLFRERLIPYSPNYSPPYNSRLTNDHVTPQPISLGRGTRPIQDRSGALWIATNAGIARIKLDQTAITTWRHDSTNPATLSAGRVRAITIDHHGILWVGTDVGLSRYDSVAGSWRHYYRTPSRPGGIPHNTINVLYEDRDGKLVVGTNDGVVRYDDRSDHFTRPLDIMPWPYTSKVWSILHDRRRRMWIGSSDMGITRLDSANNLDRWIQHDTSNPNTITGGGVWCMLEDSRGDIWIGTNDGLSRWIPETDGFRRYIHRPGDRRSLGGRHIWALHEDRNGSIWVCSYGGGISRYNPATDDFTTITTRDGLIDNGVFGILEDEKGNFWISTTRGLVCWDRSSNTFSHYDERDGLQGNEFAFKAFYKSDDGTMYFGGIDGLSKIRPSELRQNTLAPLVAITGFQIFDSLAAHQLINGDTIRLGHTENFFSFEFAALAYTNPGKNQYRYRLDGVDPDWVSTAASNRIASYTDLSPGTYTFHVLGSNNDGVWSETPVSVTVIIAPPWWQTWWFRGAVVLLGIGVAMLALRMRTNELRRREREKRDSMVKAALEMQERERERIARDLHDGVGQLLAASQINLTQAREIIDAESAGNGSVAKLHTALERTSSTLERASDDVRAISHALGSSTLRELGLVAALEELIANVQAHALTQFELVTSGLDRPLPDPVEAGLFRIVQELVANITRHADAGEATVQIVREGSEVRLTVEDNGNGFDPTATNDHHGMGRQNIAARVEALGGQLHYDSTPGHGTTVTVVIGNVTG